MAGQALATGSRTGLGPLAGRLPAGLGAAAGALLATVGLVLEALAPSAPLAGAGLALGLLGIALCWPLLMAAGARSSPRPALAVGGLTTAGYGGFLIGPALVGWVAGAFGLRWSLGVLAAFALVPAAILPAARLRPRPPRSRRGSP
jgi:MFS family permease